MRFLYEFGCDATRGESTSSTGSSVPGITKADAMNESLLCPVDILGCERFPTPEAAIDHVLAEHEPRLIATVLLREATANRYLTYAMDNLSADVEREVDAIIPDPLNHESFIEIQFQGEG